MKWLNDGGHGGTDPGAVSNGITEKEYTLEAALYVDKRLKQHGIESGLSRDKDITLEPKERTAAVKASKAPFGLSHHYNAGGGAGAEFIHSIHSDGKFELLLAEEFKNAGYPVRRVFSKKGNNNKDYYYMHRDSGYCRVSIIEYDFVDGPNAEKLKDKAYREGMYECVVRAVCREEEVPYYPVAQPTNVIKYIYTGGYAGPALLDIHNYLNKTGHNFDVKRGPDWSIIFLIGPFDEGLPNFAEARASIQKIGNHSKVLSREEAANWRK